jgi:hypothetical protein
MENLLNFAIAHELGHAPCNEMDEGKAPERQNSCERAFHPTAKYNLRAKGDAERCKPMARNTVTRVRVKYTAQPSKKHSSKQRHEALFRRPVRNVRGCRTARSFSKFLTANQFFLDCPRGHRVESETRVF